MCLCHGMKRPAFGGLSMRVVILHVLGGEMDYEAILFGGQ
eukprot:gene17087-17277_t